VKSIRVPSAHLLLLEEHAGAGAHLALDALPGLVVRDHRLLQLVLGLQAIKNPESPNQPANQTRHHKRTHPGSGTHQRDEMVAFLVRQEPPVQERPGSHTEPHSLQTPARHRVLREGESEIRSSPGAPGKLDHAGGVEGAGAPARCGSADLSAGEEEREHGGEGEEVAAGSHGAATARWEDRRRTTTTGGGHMGWGRRRRRWACESVTDSGPPNTWTLSEE